MLNSVEKACLEQYRNGVTPFAGSSEPETKWLVFGLQLVLEAGAAIRHGPGLLQESRFALKEDGSPVTNAEHEIESMARQRLELFAPEAAFVGEETGGVFTSSGTEVAMDPIDGTWGFLSETATCATTLAAFQDGVPFLGLVANPSYGEIGYWTGEFGSRLIRLSVFGEADVATSLPSTPPAASPVLVNVHPARGVAPVLDRLHASWVAGEVQMVRSIGGSPSWSLLEAAKGHFTYVNLWASRKTQSYDLAAATLILRGAGGEVIDLEGRPIDEIRHKGPFVAGIHPEARAKVAGLVRKALEI